MRWRVLLTAVFSVVDDAIKSPICHIWLKNRFGRWIHFWIHFRYTQKCRMGIHGSIVRWRHSSSIIYMYMYVCQDLDPMSDCDYTIKMWRFSSVSWMFVFQSRRRASPPFPHAYFSFDFRNSHLLNSLGLIYDHPQTFIFSVFRSIHKFWAKHRNKFNKFPILYNCTVTFVAYESFWFYVIF